MIEIPFAHVGHWAVNLLYVMPILIVVGVLMSQSWRDRRDEQAAGPRDKPADTPPVA